LKNPDRQGAERRSKGPAKWDPQPGAVIRLETRWP
jgi:hypothetical protein